jgi:hypothetical protein
MELNEAGRQQLMQSFTALRKKRCRPEMIYFCCERWTETLCGCVPVKIHDWILAAMREGKIGESLLQSRRYRAHRLAEVFSRVRTTARREERFVSPHVSSAFCSSTTKSQNNE